MTNLSTQIIVDDDELMEYEINPRQWMPSKNENQNKRHHFLIHDTVRPAPTTLVIGSRQPSVVKPVGVEDSMDAPDSSLIFVSGDSQKFMVLKPNRPQQLVIDNLVNFVRVTKQKAHISSHGCMFMDVCSR